MLAVPDRYCLIECSAQQHQSVLIFQVTEDEFLRLQALYMARIEELELKV